MATARLRARRSMLSEQTLIPLSFAMVLLGGAYFVTETRALTLENAKDIVNTDAVLQAHVTEDMKLKKEILDRLARMETQLQFMYEDAKARRH